jgi:hypothetical protein
MRKLCRVGEIPSGHMVYVNEDVLKQFHADVAAFIKRTENGK